MGDAIRGRAWRCLGALALSVWATACASTGATPKPFPRARAGSAPPPAQPAVPPPNTTPEDAAASPPSSAETSPSERRTDGGRRAVVDGYALAGAALSLRGTPYRNGGSDTRGFDCSGFTQYVFARFGVALPRAVRDQFQVGTSIGIDQIAAGDMVFFATTDPGPSHVAIAIGGDQFVHAPSSSGVVRVEHLSSSYWSPRFLGARRITDH